MTIDELKKRIKDISNELSYCRRLDRVGCGYSKSEMFYRNGLYEEREQLRKELRKLQRKENNNGKN